MYREYPSHFLAATNLERRIFFASHIAQKNPSPIRFIIPSYIMPAVMEFMLC
jgi:hypothetical protein